MKKYYVTYLFIPIILLGCHKTNTTEDQMPFLEPKMINIPSGEFLMGCVSGKHCRENEFPVHRVKIESFKMSETEVTFGLWDLCVADGNCSHRPDHKWVPDKNTGLRDNLPVMLVTFFDITEEFIPWLNNKTGKNYRLPTEAEWEYAARAGGKTPFYTGNCLPTNNANYDGNKPLENCSDEEYRGKAMPVGSFSPNDFGLYDMHGNVWEWTQDCWNKSNQEIPAKGNYLNATPDGKANLIGDCSLRVIRGGAWNTGANYSRSAYRDWYYAGQRYYSKGFRLAMSN